MAIPAPATDLGRTAPDFRLPGTDDKTYTLADIAGEEGTVVVFICNHCPYVRAVVDRMAADAELLAKEGIGFVAISSNDSEAYPEDSFDNMKLFASRNGFSFPYLYDETQAVGRAYGAVCTPDFFGLDTNRVIRYRSRLDAGRKDPPPSGTMRELVEAMRFIARTGEAPAEQIPSIGCSIKWRED